MATIPRLVFVLVWNSEHVGKPNEPSVPFAA